MLADEAPYYVLGLVGDFFFIILFCCFCEGFFLVLLGFFVGNGERRLDRATAKIIFKIVVSDEAGADAISSCLIVILLLVFFVKYWRSKEFIILTIIVVYHFLGHSFFYL